MRVAAEWRKVEVSVSIGREGLCGGWLREEKVC
jgi:hypothetical protein